MYCAIQSVVFSINIAPFPGIDNYQIRFCLHIKSRQISIDNVLCIPKGALEISIKNKGLLFIELRYPYLNPPQMNITIAILSGLDDIRFTCLIRIVHRIFLINVLYEIAANIDV